MLPYLIIIFIIFMEIQTIIGQYKFISNISNKGTNRIDLVQNSKHQKFVAKSIFIQQYSEDDINKLRRQIVSSLQFEHPNLIITRQFFFVNNQKTLVLIMQYCDERDIFWHINNLDDSKEKQILLGICQGLSYIHTKGHIHGNLKLSNILIKNSVPKITDFGFMKNLIQGASGNGGSLYIAPELLYSNTYIQSVDIFALGVIFTQIILKRRINKCYQGLKIPGDRPHFPEQLRHLLQNHFLTQLLIKMMHKDARQRPSIRQIKSQLIQCGQINPQNQLRLQKQRSMEQIIQKQHNLEQLKQLLSPRIQLKYLKSDKKQNLIKLNLSLLKIDDIILQKILSKHQYISDLNCANTLITDNCAKFLFQKLSQLFKLNLGGNHLTDEFFHLTTSNLYKLKILQISFTDVTDKAIQIIKSSAPLIQKLDLSYTKVTSQGLLTLTQMKFLNSLSAWSGTQENIKYYEYTQINLSRNWKKYFHNKIMLTNDFIDGLVKKLSNFGQLTLNLNQQQIDDIIKNINKSATHISINGSMNESSSIRKIIQNREAIEIYLNEIDFRQSRIMALYHYLLNYNRCFTSLKIQSLSLINTNFSPCLIKNATLLKYLDLTGSVFDQKQLVQIIIHFKQLTVLNLNSTSVTDLQIIQIANHLNNLIVFNLSQTKITDASIIYLSQKLKKLQILDLTNTKITDISIKEVSRHLKHLTGIYLDSTKITDASVMCITHYLKDLKVLFLSSTQITDASVDLIAHNLKKLSVVILNNTKVSDKAIVKLQQNLNELNLIILKGIKLTEATIQRIRKNAKLTLYL